jgi:hypothetical protein
MESLGQTGIVEREEEKLFEAIAHERVRDAVLVGGIVRPSSREEECGDGDEDHAGEGNADEDLDERLAASLPRVRRRRKDRRTTSETSHRTELSRRGRVRRATLSRYNNVAEKAP